MKTTTKFILSAVASSFLALAAFAQANISGKVFVAEVNGAVTYVVGGKVVKLEKGASLPVEGAHIETAAGSSLVLVYSNGTSIYIDENTIVDIRRFLQKPFTPGVDTTAMEPSASDTLARITQGRVIVSTNELSTGTSMVYQTPDAQVRIRGHEVVIEVQNQSTNVVLLAGDVTVTPVNAPPGDIGQSLHTGETAVITSNSASTTAAATVQIVPNNLDLTNALAPKFASTERAQSTVVFQSITTPAGNGSETATTVIQALAVVPAAMPVQLTVSPSTLRTGT
ncbi:MAG TPA: FecR domain-containing protein [Opitutaceae bacterium]|nr:FecR domain-containing protein [Opitutaceae bacterium]